MNKDTRFINKINKNELYLVDTVLQTISLFITNEINNLLSNCLLLFISFVIVCMNNVWFLLIGLVCILVSTLFGVIKYFNKKSILKVVINNQNINNNVTCLLIEYLSGSTIEKDKLFNQIKNNYFSFLNLQSKQTMFNGCFNFFNEIFHDFIYMIVVIVCTFLIINITSFNIGKLTLIISLIGMISTSSNNINSFFHKHIEYREMIKIYNKILYVGNKNDDNASNV
ncbi:MAG: hypothetical protein LBL60_00625 [Mycoplasmataceae bacterium]|nr:hypothetical protein [Mycoplasmataceae bacterium]